jgi:riboflavin synthase alpha subunit
MFTGLIETSGTVVSVERSRGAAVLGIRPEKAGFSPRDGASIAVNGVCLTLEQIRGNTLFFTAVAETLARTTLGSIMQSARVNLEQAMPANGRFDGHIVLGHVDGIGMIVADSPEGTGTLRTVRVPENCEPLMAEKGSVAIDGISLTIASVKGDRITIALIPRTLEATTMSRKRTGAAVNIECDILARYVHGMLTAGQQPGDLQQSRVPNNRESLLKQMERAGF